LRTSCQLHASRCRPKQTLALSEANGLEPGSRTAETAEAAS
jgi:hypothetical protein